jgi:hypothetical protein
MRPVRSADTPKMILSFQISRLIPTMEHVKPVMELDHLRLFEKKIS